MVLREKVSIFLLLFTIGARESLASIPGETESSNGLQNMEIINTSSTNESEHCISTAEIGITFFS